LEQIIETLDSKFDDENLLSLAISVIFNFSFVGVTERYQESIKLIAKISGFNVKYPEINKTINLYKLNVVLSAAKKNILQAQSCRFANLKVCITKTGLFLK
jgi:hypothetical protein